MKRPRDVMNESCPRCRAPAGSMCVNVLTTERGAQFGGPREPLREPHRLVVGEYGQILPMIVLDIEPEQR